MLWVRTQDKKRLINVNEIYIDANVIKANYKEYYSGCEYVFLGEYSKEERAIEILDEIQEKIEYYLDDKLSTIYEMPEE